MIYSLLKANLDPPKTDLTRANYDVCVGIYVDVCVPEGISQFFINSCDGSKIMSFGKHIDHVRIHRLKFFLLLLRRIEKLAQLPNFCRTEMSVPKYSIVGPNLFSA